jgi:hypothetical protein
VEEESSPLSLKDVVTNLKEETMNLEDRHGNYNTICNGFQCTKQLANGTSLT